MRRVVIAPCSPFSVTPDLMRATNHVLDLLGRRPITLDEVRVFVGHGARALLTRPF